jgi:hypothetical protein
VGPHRIWSEERAQNGIGLGQCAGNALFIPGPLSLIIGQNHDGSSGVTPSLAAHIPRRFEHADGNVGAAIEGFLIEQRFQIPLHLFQAIGEGQAQPGCAVEHHDCHAILIAQNAQSLMSGGGDALNVGPHAGAHIQQQQDVHGHVLAGKIANLLGTAVFAEDEILSFQSDDSAIGTIHDLRIHAHQ